MYYVNKQVFKKEYVYFIYENEKFHGMNVISSQ